MSVDTLAAALPQIEALQERKRQHVERVRLATLAREAMPEDLARMIKGWREMGAPWFVGPTRSRATMRRRTEWAGEMAKSYGIPPAALEAAFADIWQPY